MDRTEANSHNAHIITARLALISAAVLVMLACSGQRGFLGFIIGPLAGAAFLALARSFPRHWLLPAILFCIPLTVVPHFILPVRVSLSDFVVLIAALSLLFQRSKPDLPEGRPQLDPILAVLLASYLGTALITAGIALHHGRTHPLIWLEIAKVIVLCLYAWLTCCLVLRGADERKLVVPWFLMAIVQSALSCLAVAGIAIGFNLPFLYGKRGCGTMIDPNSFAAYLNATVLVALGVAGTSASKLLRALALAVAAFCFIGLVAAASLGGFFAFGAGLVVLLCLSKWDRRLIRIIIVLVLGTAVIGGLLAGATGSNLFSMAASRLAFTDDDPGYRWKLWSKALDLISANPLFGVGRGGYPLALNMTKDGVYGIPHNTFLGLGAELGLVGLAIFVALIMRAVYLLLTSEDKGKLPAIGVVAAISALLVQGLTINTENTRILWIIVGLAMPHGRRKTAVRWELSRICGANVDAGKRSTTTEVTRMHNRPGDGLRFSASLIDMAKAQGYDVHVACRMNPEDPHMTCVARAIDLPFMRRVDIPRQSPRLFKTAALDGQRTLFPGASAYAHRRLYRPSGRGQPGEAPPENPLYRAWPPFPGEGTRIGPSLLQSRGDIGRPLDGCHRRHEPGRSALGTAFPIGRARGGDPGIGVDPESFSPLAPHEMRHDGNGGSTTPSPAKRPVSR